MVRRKLVEECRKAILRKDGIHHLDAQVSLKDLMSVQFQKALQIGRCGIGSIELGKGRRD